ncbi:MAG TPA: ornithine cyclodeaminase family protein [Pyrinomonadaceae bacterium]|nr:ornithine cyclodeaminase family protein [Pyrinomonadaceae bacterium]
MPADGTLILTGRDVSALLTIEECMAAVEHAFKLHGERKTQPPGILGIHADNGGFHIKAGLLDLNRSYFAAKINANFPGNPKRNGLPTVQGVVLLCDGEDGYPLAVMDSIEITTQRTGAATGVAAKYLARTDSKTVTVCGCGIQGRISVRALSRVLPIEKVFAFDIDRDQTERLTNDLAVELGVKIESVDNLETALKQSDVCVTCTPSKQPFLKEEFIAPGTFIAAVGADNPEKQELQPTILSRNTVVADVIEQGATIGELHHALTAALMTREDVHAELGQVIAGTKPGRSSADEIIVFDSTGMALQDVVTAATIYEKAVKDGVGTRIDFALV